MDRNKGNKKVVAEKLFLKEEDNGFQKDCILGCVQLIWIHGVQEFVLCVLGGLHGALSVCI
jgi:hypothetical protein